MPHGCCGISIGQPTIDTAFKSIQCSRRVCDEEMIGSCSAITSTTRGLILSAHLNIPSGFSRAIGGPIHPVSLCVLRMNPCSLPIVAYRNLPSDALLSRPCGLWRDG